MNKKATCPDCGDVLGAITNNDCCDTEIVKRIIDEKLDELVEQGEEPAVSKDWVIEKIKEKVHPTRLLNKAREGND